MTNRDVAAALSISPKTVEANLSRVYHKLDICSRVELGRRIIRLRIDEHIVDSRILHRRNVSCGRRITSSAN